MIPNIPSFVSPFNPFPNPRLRTSKTSVKKASYISKKQPPTCDTKASVKTDMPYEERTHPQIIPIKRERERDPVLSIDTSLFQNTTVVLTGATGFVGSTILCALLDKTHADFILFIRPKDGVQPHTRFTKFLHTNPVFRELSTTDIESRVRVVSSDMEGENLLLDTNAWNNALNWTAANKRNISLVHCCANLDFSAALTDMFPINVLSVIALTQLLDNCRVDVKNIVYVSTGKIV